MEYNQNMFARTEDVHVGIMNSYGGISLQPSGHIHSSSLSRPVLYEWTELLVHSGIYIDPYRRRPMAEEIIEILFHRKDIENDSITIQSIRGLAVNQEH